VGVVGDVRQESPADQPGATLYMPMTQHPFYANQIHVVLRTSVKPLSLMSAVDERIAKTNPMIARRYTTMDAMGDKSIATERFRAALISSFAVVGLLWSVLGHATKMACVGILIGVVSSAVLARLVENMLVGVKSTDPVSLGLVSAVLLITALGAALGPGWSATRVSSMAALRAE
jgi:putative ABC transport system permease protein